VAERVRVRRTPRPGGGGAGAARRRGREPKLTRPRGVVAATTGLLGLSSTRRAAVLALVVCAIALTVVVPLRNYVAQRQELAAVTEQQRVLASDVASLTEQKATLQDPAEIEAQARSRIGYALPGEVPYVVQFPQAPVPRSAGDDPAALWYRSLWREITAGSP
jgi:cell division protein FtsB